MFDLTELQRDALMETFNIAVGRASKSLALLLGCEAALSVPLIVQADMRDAASIVDPALRRQSDACMASRFFGGVDVEAVMIFQGPRENIASLLNLPVSASDGHADARQNVATKIAALVTESCAAEIQDLVGREVSRGPIRFLSTIPEQVFSVRGSDADVMIIVKIDIALKKRGVTGHLLLSFTQDSANSLADGLDKLLSGSEGED